MPEYRYTRAYGEKYFERRLFCKTKKAWVVTDYCKNVCKEMCKEGKIFAGYT